MFKSLVLTILVFASVSHALPVSSDEPMLEEFYAPVEEFTHHTAIFTGEIVISIPSQMAQLIYGKSPAEGIVLSEENVFYYNNVSLPPNLAGSSYDTVAETPEPASMALLVGGLGVLSRLRKSTSF